MADSGASESTEVTDEDRAAVLEVLRQFDGALDRRDVDELALLCLEDFTFFGSGAGEESIGPAGLAQMLSDLREEVAAVIVDWRLEVEDEYSVAVRGDGAVVTGHGRFLLETRESTRAGRYLLMYVLHRTADGWRLWAYHGSEPQPW